MCTVRSASQVALAGRSTRQGKAWHGVPQQPSQRNDPEMNATVTTVSYVTVSRDGTLVQRVARFVESPCPKPAPKELVVRVVDRRS